VKKRLKYAADARKRRGALKAGRATVWRSLHWRCYGCKRRESQAARHGNLSAPNKAGIELKDAALHRFIEIYIPDRGWVFTDPNRTFGAVTAEYLYLGPAGADYSRYEGVRITRRRLTSSLNAEKRGGETYYSRAMSATFCCRRPNDPCRRNPRRCFNASESEAARATVCLSRLRSAGNHRIQRGARSARSMRLS